MKILFCCANVFLSDFMLKSSSKGSLRISKGSQSLREHEKIESKGKSTRVGSGGNSFWSLSTCVVCFYFLKLSIKSPTINFEMS